MDERSERMIHKCMRKLLVKRRYRKFTACERVEECEDAFASEFIADGESVEDERE